MQFFFLVRSFSRTFISKWSSQLFIIFFLSSFALYCHYSFQSLQNEFLFFFASLSTFLWINDGWIETYLSRSIYYYYFFSSFVSLFQCPSFCWCSISLEQTQCWTKLYSTLNSIWMNVYLCPTSDFVPLRSK